MEGPCSPGADGTGGGAHLQTTTWNAKQNQALERGWTTLLKEKGGIKQGIWKSFPCLWKVRAVIFKGIFWFKHKESGVSERKKEVLEELDSRTPSCWAPRSSLGEAPDLTQESYYLRYWSQFSIKASRIVAISVPNAQVWAAVVVCQRVFIWLISIRVYFTQDTLSNS